MLNHLKGIHHKDKKAIADHDKDLILNCQKEDVTSFAPLYSRYSKPIYKYINKHVKSGHVAEEICQDIFLKIYQHRKSYNPDYDVSTWVWTIARNTVYDHLRSTRTSPAEVQSLEPALTHQWEPASNETAESIMIEELEKVKLLNLMTELSAKQKQAIFLRLVKKFSYHEISKSMNLSLSAVKSLINRGKGSLTKLKRHKDELCASTPLAAESDSA